MRALKNVKVLAALGLIAVLVAVALQPRRVGVDVAAVTRGPVQVTIDEEGETRVRKRFVVSAPVAGQVLRIELEPGDKVTRGSAIAAIQPGVAALLDARERAEATARVQAAEAGIGRTRAELQRARAAHEFAVAEAKRGQELADASLIPKQDLEARESRARITAQDVEASEFALRTAQEELRVARARLTPAATGGSGQPVNVRAPVSGVVLKRLRESEAVVAAGEPLLEIGDANDLEIVADLLSTDAVKVRAGQAVRIEQWGGDQPLVGTVRLVEPAGFTKVSALGVEEQRVNVIIAFAEVDEAWHALGDGYRVEVRIVIAQKDAVLKVPASSLFRRGEGHAVFVVDDDRARLQAVEIGLRTGLDVEITSGLREGERVIVHPPDTIADGARVEVRAGAAQ